MVLLFTPMVPIVDGNSDIVAQVRRILCYLICSRNSAQIWFCSQKKNILLHACARYAMLPSNKSTTCRVFSFKSLACRLYRITAKGICNYSFSTGGPEFDWTQSAQKISCSLKTILEPLEGPQGCPGVLKSNHEGPKKKPDFKTPLFNLNFRYASLWLYCILHCTVCPGSKDPYCIVSY